MGIAGPPGAGKSTLAARLTEVFADGVVVPMDGFHLANVELARLGHADRKGAPVHLRPARLCGSADGGSAHTQTRSSMPPRSTT